MLSWQSPSVPTLTPRPDAGARLRLFDTATQRLVSVGPTEGTARVYVCGITPYDATHLGHATTYVSFDLVNRAWRDLGLRVAYAQNVTDVDDPLLERAEATGVAWDELADDQTHLFRRDMEALNVLAPDHYIGAVECIACVSDLMAQIQGTGFLYQIEDAEFPDWYFRCELAPGFGGVSHLSEDEMLATFAERGGDPDRPGKKHPLDALVWRMERPGEPAWDSPLGRGRPGWHIECTAISLKYLGPDIDVQGGGSDLVFPHHEMCAAQGVVAAREPFAETFVHSGMVGLAGEKMSKSRGNLVLVSTLRDKGVDPMAIRLALLAHHYRSDWEWTDDDLSAATERLRLWRDAVHARTDGAATADATEAAEVVTRVRSAMLNDVDAPAALAVIDAWAQARSSRSADGPADDAGATVAALCDALLGVRL